MILTIYRDEKTLQSSPQFLVSHATNHTYHSHPLLHRCPAVLKNLVKTFSSIGRHCWPTSTDRMPICHQQASVCARVHMYVWSACVHVYMCSFACVCVLAWCCDRILYSWISFLCSSKAMAV